MLLRALSLAYLLTNVLSAGGRDQEPRLQVVDLPDGLGDVLVVLHGHQEEEFGTVKSLNYRLKSPRKENKYARIILPLL